MRDRTWLRLMRMGAYLGCHQKSDRSFFWKNSQVPLCARCSGIFVAQCITLPLFFIIPMSCTIAFWGLVIMFIDWLYSKISKKYTSNRRRFIVGLLGGHGLMVIELSILRFVYVTLTT